MQFVRVMLNMAKDLGFFSLVWFILTLAFGAAMHGAVHGEDNWGQRNSNETGGSTSAMSDQGRLPMQRWSSWWLIRTYLQSLGEVGLQRKRPALHCVWRYRILICLARLKY